MMRFLYYFFAMLLAPAIAGADEARDDHPVALPSTPEEQLKKFHVPPGFEVQLVAAEPEIQKPLNIAFDVDGNLWVSVTQQYPWPAAMDANGNPLPDFERAYQAIANSFGSRDAAPPPEKRGLDAIVVLEKINPQTGKVGNVRTFAEGLNIPIGLQPLPRAPNQKGDHALAFSIPNIWRLEDHDGDGIAEKREAIYQGFEYLDTHGMASNFIQWIDGWIYACHGFKNKSNVVDRLGRSITLQSGNTFRFKPDGSQLEIFSHGQTNPFGLAFDAFGNLFSADSHSKPIYLLDRGGFYEGIQKTDDGLGFAPRMTDDDHGSSAIAGISIYQDVLWPEEYWGNAFNGNPVTRCVNRAEISWQAGSPRSKRVADFLTCDDPWFRPVQVKLGPDGALYIADFYNPIIAHYEVPLNDPRRDRSRGRIWRVVYQGKTHQPPFVKMDSPNLEHRRLATMNAVANSEEKQATNLLNGKDPLAASNGLWALEKLGLLDHSQLLAAARHQDAHVRRQAAAIIGNRQKVDADFLTVLSKMLDDSEAQVRRGALAALAQHPNAQQLQAILTCLEKNNQDPHLLYQAKVCLREHLSQVDAFSPARELAKTSHFFSDTLNQVSLAIKSPQAAQFLFEQLLADRLDDSLVEQAFSHMAKNFEAKDIQQLAELIPSFAKASPLRRIALAGALDAASPECRASWSADTISWIHGVLFDELKNHDSEHLAQVIEVLRPSLMVEKLEPLSALIMNPSAPVEQRSAAVDAMDNLLESTPYLIRALTQADHDHVRMKAAFLLGQRANLEIIERMLDELTRASLELSQIIAGALARSDQGCGPLLDSIQAGKISPTLLQHPIVAAALRHRTPAMRARADQLTKGLQSETERIDQLITQRLVRYDSQKIDLAIGKDIYQKNCQVCHSFAGGGGQIGPSLDGVSARGLARLMEDILDPNRQVDPAFHQTTFELNDGRSVSGGNAQESGGEWTLQDASGKSHRLSNSQIRDKSTSTLSLMPAIFEHSIPEQDFFHLIAYLTEILPAPKR